MAKISRLSPLSEFTLRKLETPFTNNFRELVRAFCVSIGVLQPGDSRDVIVDVMVVLLKYSKKQKVLYSAEVKQVVCDYRSHMNLELRGVSSSNILRDLKILKDKGFIEIIGGGYRLREWMPLSKIFNEHVENYLIKTTIERIKEYCDRIDSIT